MKKTSLFCIVMLLLSTNSILRAQDSLPRIIIGDVLIYESTDSIVGEGIQGYVSYDAPTNTLFLNNASTPFIWAYRSERCLKIKLIGNNSITKILTTNDSCAFFGPGTLNLGNSSVEIALDCSRTDYLALTEGATLNITASGAGIFSLYDYTMDSDSILHFPSLIIDNSSLVITAPYCCQFIWDWWLSDCHVVAPQDFEYQLDTWTFLPSGMVSDYLEIRPGTVGVPIHSDTDWQAWGVNGGLQIKGLSDNQTIEVMNILGQMVYDAVASGVNTFVPLKAGPYLVHINNRTVKIIVK